MSTKTRSEEETIYRLTVAAITAPVAQTGAGQVADGGHILIVDDGSELVPVLVNTLRSSGSRTLVIQAKARPVAAPTIAVDWQDPASVEVLIERMRQVKGGVRGIFFLSTPVLTFDDSWLSGALAGLRRAVVVARGVSLCNGEPLGFLYFVTAQGGRFGLEHGARADALAVGIEGLAHPLRMEMPKTVFRSIDLDPRAPGEEQAKALLAEIDQAEVPFRTTYGWKDGIRATLSVQAVPETAPAPADLAPGSVVVFAGGARGIGAVCAKALAGRIHCRVVFLGRTPIGPEAEALAALDEAGRKQRGDAFMGDYKASHPGCTPKAPREAWRKQLQAVETVGTLAAIRAQGSEASYHAVDVRDREAVERVFAEVKEHFGRLDVAVHVAGLGGVDTDRMLMRKEWSTIDQVIETKVVGAMHILAAAEQVGARLFIGFGSIASRFGNSGQVDYASANGLLTGIVRAHNARGVLPEAKVLGWGAWDGVGMAVSGPTKDALMAYGVRFISPEQGAACFLRELVPGISKANPAEVYLSPSWRGLTEMLEKQEAPLDLDGGSAALMGAVVEARSGEYLRAEHLLDPKAIPFIDHHRYDGTAWVPAVMSMEVSVEAASALFPELTAFAVREVLLKKAVRLVRDESVLLITEVRFVERRAGETIVHSTVSARYKARTWIFAEMQVVLGSDPKQFADGIDDSAQFHGLRPIEAESGELAHLQHGDLYPCNWLRFQTSGPTFQVIDTMAMHCAAGRTEGQMVSTADMRGILFPMTMVDGAFQAYGVLLCEILQAWAGPPLSIGELRWLPGAAAATRSRFAIRVNLEDKVNYPILHMFDGDGRCIIRMQRGEQGGTSMKELAEQARRGGEEVPAVSPASPPPAPYLGQIRAMVPGRSLRAEKLLDPKQEILLKDHQIYIFVIVPAVYYMEAAVEAAAQLQPARPPCELRDFHIHQALHLLKDQRVLVTEAAVQPDGTTRIQMFSEQGSERKLHAEGTVVHGPLAVLGALEPWSFHKTDSRAGAGLYPHRFPNGPVFQVIERMDLDTQHRSRSDLRLTGRIATDAWLPMTLLDGAYQVDSATRSGFDRPSGLPKTFRSLRWTPEAVTAERVICLSRTEDATTECEGELFFVDTENRVLLHLAGITLTAALPATIGSRSKV